MKIYIAGDHYAVDLVEKVINCLDKNSINYENLGALEESTKVPLQEIIPKVTAASKDTENFGILICGTGAGVEIGANRFKGIRASLCIDPKQAEYARVYDKANILCLSSWITKDPTTILDAWFSAKYDGNESRLKMFEDFDTWG